MAVPFGCKPLPRPMCLASNINTEDLRSQLDQLHAEAETTRAKASNARLRLLRLSEAAEKLRRQASISVQKGMEKDARELLFQKKKVMQALDKSRSRIEVLDKLSAKLNEAISAKETQLIESIASDLEGSGEELSNPIRIISPRPQVSKDANKDTEFDCNDLIISEDQNVKFYQDGQWNQTVDVELEERKASSIATPCNEDNMISSSTTISSCEDFLEHLDQQLQKIEQELIAILNVSTLVLDNGEKPKSLKVQQTTELLDAILHLRQRITNIRQTKIQTS
ncbi:hypothetical protein SLA2020_424480 [Shorea laevis]